ncbi:MAG: PRC-barrel domain-containing protein [Acidimicrobiales bacterium]
MQFREGTEVRSASGDKLGDIERLVVDPSRDTITHLVISKGFLFPEERVVPVDIVASAGADEVLLNTTIQLDELPVFIETHYIDLEESAQRSHPTATTAPLAWGYPFLGVPAMYPTYPAGTATEVTRNVPEGSTVASTGSSVITTDGEDIGKVKAVDVSDAGDMVAIEVDPGWFRDEQTIPAHFIRDVGEDRVLLAVGSATVRQLER